MSETTISSEKTPQQQQPNGQPIRKKVKRRPARKQVTHEEAAAIKKQPEQSSQTYNIWYNKWAGGDRLDSINQKEKSKTRCKISTDAGYTRADGGNNQYCCLYFARGCCPYGSDCTYLHRLPNPSSLLADSSLDVFGREKHSNYRDDMGGVGSFSRMNRTLYIGRLKEVSNIEHLLEAHFQEWGEIERVRVLNGRGCGFVTYVSELGAQFAKEAMMCQSIVDEEILNVRWATEDPNPSAKRKEHARLIQIGSEAIGAKLNPDLVDAIEALDELESSDRSNDFYSNKSKKCRLKSPSPPPSSTHTISTATPSNIPPPLPTTISLNGVTSKKDFDEEKPPPLISAQALDGLKQLAAKRILNQENTSKQTLSNLADYGSDSE
ncbi:hypothetical protein BY996DRAFT_4585019 [Phakopsora pachyrhizi]|uniref:Pre-mRNA-splicing factor CWC2 n=1 Tax=Phakopsora pachyrhizi TaxID=170000 RepID=A0AAV0B0A8_PHAPC|nr:hypothetical protein BY996DRAFT_4585019 [Phakopsora pachyrhizi]CAH7674788.1 hypothetical protein PPACK8108_LOCUS9723 [Phakopsora pachyrhizi]